jgi:phosphatidylinositol alpha-1,6-mannosyltransferase
MNILFLSKSYPPTIGGIENQNRDVYESLRAIADITLIANTRGKKFLPLFLPYVFLKSLFLLRKHDVVLVGDGVLAPIAFALSLFAPRKTYASIIHGLDITFAHKPTLFGTLYRFVNIPALKHLDKLIAVGNHTITEAARVGIPKSQCIFIPNGIDPSGVIAKRSRQDLEKLLGRNLDNTFVILRVGRFVKHKGVEWFIRNVLPILPDDIIFVAAGGRVRSKAGDEDAFLDCQQALRDLHLEMRAHLLTDVSWSDMQTLFNTADLYVSPNIHVPGSMEGFGINAIEAALCKRVVIASNMEGLQDAIQNNISGILVEPENPHAFVKPILEFLDDAEKRISFGKQARKYALEHFTRDTMARRYLDALSAIKK